MKNLWKKCSFIIIVFIFSCKVGYTQTSILVYYNNFESPASTPFETVSEAYNDLDSRQVNTIWGGTGTGSTVAAGAGFFYQPQNLTVETLILNGPDGVYNDPSGIAGKYSIGMLANIENDKLALKLDVTRPTSGGTFPYINLNFVLTSISLQLKNGNSDFNNNTIAPAMEMRIYNAPNWTSSSTVNFNSPGTQIGPTRIVTGGIRPNPTTAPYAFNWVNVSANFPLTNSLPNYNGKVIIIFDLLPNTTAANNLYATFDNLRITADLVALPVNFGEITAHISNDKLNVNWATLSETDNDHFDIEASNDGVKFKKIGTVVSKALNGYSDVKLYYQFSSPLSPNTLLLGFSIMMIGLATLKIRKLRPTLLCITLILSLLTLSIACKKTDAPINLPGVKKLHIRILQFDKDGSYKASKTITAYSIE